MNVISFKFDNQDGTSYFFEVGFFNEGENLPSFGEDPLQQMFPLSGILGKVPLRLYQGEWIGDYQIPVDLLLRGCKSRPWLPEDSLDDILIAWEPLVGFLIPEKYEILYTPVTYSLPTDYQDALDGSEEEGDYKYFIPNAETDWPEQYEEAEYLSRDVSGSVSLEGAFLQSGYEWLYAGEESDPDTGLITRLWGSPEHVPQFTGHWVESVSSYINLWGVYNENYPETPFLGLQSPKPKVDIFSGLNATFPFPVYEYTNTIWPFLSPTKPGDQVHAKIPRSLSDDFVFPPEEILPIPAPPQLAPVPFVFSLPLLALLLPQMLRNLFPLATFKLAPFCLSAPRDYVIIVNTDDWMTVNTDDHVKVEF